MGSLVLNLYRYFTCNLTFCVATSQSERTVQALHQSVEVAERRAVEVEERANTQVQEVKRFCESQISCGVHTLSITTIATTVALRSLWCVDNEGYSSKNIQCPL